MRISDVRDAGRGGAGRAWDVDDALRGLGAEDVAVDDVAEAAEDLADQSEDSAAVERDEAVQAKARSQHEERGRASENGAEERHAAVPDGQNHLPLAQVAIYQAPLLNPTTHAPPDHSRDLPPDPCPIQL